MLIKFRIILVIILFFISTQILANESYHILQKGETLYSIARNNNIPVQILIKFNNIKDPSNIKTGTKILFPKCHIVIKGDTLYNISKRYGVSIQAIRDLNSLSTSNQIKLNQQLYIPLPLTGDDSQEVIRTESNLYWPHHGARRKYQGKFSGILITGQKGDSVYSVCSGEVVWAGIWHGYGYVVLVEAQNSYIYGYLGHQQLVVKVGDSVKRGTEIGKMGINIQKDEPNLLFMVFYKGKYLDPYQVLSNFN